MAGPADIVRACLVSQGLVIVPSIPGRNIPLQQTPGDGTTVCFVDSLPDNIDQAVFIHDTVGMFWGKVQKDGKSKVHPGFKVLIRALTNEVGRPLADSISAGLDNCGTNFSIIVDGTTYFVQSIYKTTSLVSLGEQVGKKRRQWSVNGRIAFQDQQSAIG